jgi:hypothetical protein
MIAATNLVAAFQWDPGLRGLLTVVLAVLILYGSVALIVATNTGARLGSLIAVSALSGWMLVMGLVWSMYGIGWKGDAPSWKVKDVVEGSPAGSSVVKARTLPLPGEADNPLPVATELRDENPAFLKEFPLEKRAPNLGDLIPLQPSLEGEINGKLDGWKIFSVSNRYTGELQSAAAVAVEADGLKIFESADEFVFLDSYYTGGNKPRTDQSIKGRIIHKVTQTLDVFHPPFLAAVQVQAVIPQETKPGQAPPTPVRDQNAPVYTVIFERDRGNLRQPAMAFTLFNGIVFAITANMLHRRDKLAAAQRAAVVAAGAA